MLTRTLASGSDATPHFLLEPFERAALQVVSRCSEPCWSDPTWQRSIASWAEQTTEIEVPVVVIHVELPPLGWQSPADPADAPLEREELVVERPVRLQERDRLVVPPPSAAYGHQSPWVSRQWGF